MLNEFKKFIFKGNVIDLSTGVIIGAAFATIVAAFTKGIVEPILKLVGGDRAVVLGFELSDGVYIDLGLIISAVINFLITAAVVFFVIIKPVNRLSDMLKREEALAPPPPPPADVQLLTEIRDLLKAQV
jgi:large conductance mechanosensitive channel